MLIPRHSEVYGRIYSEARNGRKRTENLVLQKKSCSRKQNWQHVFVRDMLRNGIPRVCFYFCSTERNSELLSLPRNGSEQNSKCLLLYLFHGTEFQIVFSSAEWFRTEFREFASILFHGTEFRAFFFSAERFGTEFWEFSAPRNSQNSAGTNQLIRLFRLPRNYFFVGNCQLYGPWA